MRSFAAKAVFAKQSQMEFFQQLSLQWVVKKWSFENKAKTKPNATGSNRGGAMIRGGLNPKNRSWADRSSDMRREPCVCLTRHFDFRVHANLKRLDGGRD